MFCLDCSHSAMKSVLVCVVVALAFYVTSSQPTCDDCGVSDCGCEKELEVLQSQIIMLNKKIDSIINNGKTKEIIDDVTTPPSVPPSVPNKPTSGTFEVLSSVANCNDLRILVSHLTTWCRGGPCHFSPPPNVFRSVHYLRC